MPTLSHVWKLLLKLFDISSFVIAIINIKSGIIIGIRSIVSKISLLEDFDDITPKNDPTTEYPILNINDAISIFTVKIFKLNKIDETKKTIISEMVIKIKKAIDLENNINSEGIGMTINDCKVLFCSSW